MEWGSWGGFGVPGQGLVFGEVVSHKEFGVPELAGSPHVQVIHQGLGEAGGGRDGVPAAPLWGDTRGDSAVRAGATPARPDATRDVSIASPDVSVIPLDVTARSRDLTVLPPPLRAPQGPSGFPPFPPLLTDSRASQWGAALR